MKIKSIVVFSIVLLASRTEATLIHGFKCVGEQIEVIGLGQCEADTKDATLQGEAFMRLIGSIEDYRQTLILCEMKRGQPERLDLYRKSFMTQVLKSLTSKQTIPLDIKNVRLKGTDIRSEASEIFTDFLVALPMLKTVVSENQKPDKGHLFRRQLAFDVWMRSYDKKNVSSFMSSSAWKADLKEKIEKLREKFFLHGKNMPEDMASELAKIISRLRKAFNTYCDLIPTQFKTPKDLLKFLDFILSDGAQYEKFLKTAQCLNRDITDCGMALILWDEITRYRNSPGNNGNLLRIVMLNNVAHTVFIQRFIKNILKFASILEFGTTDAETFLEAHYEEPVCRHLTEQILEELFAYCSMCGAVCTQDGNSVWRQAPTFRDFYCSQECSGEAQEVNEELAKLLSDVTLDQDLVVKRRKLYVEEAF